LPGNYWTLIDMLGPNLQAEAQLFPVRAREQSDQIPVEGTVHGTWLEAFRQSGLFQVGVFAHRVSKTGTGLTRRKTGAIAPIAVQQD
jgi:hypothetical protein